jgi:hypothetical protein
MERVEGGCPRGGEGEGGCPKGRRGWGRLQPIGRRGRGRLGLGRGAPIHQIEIKGPNTLSHLSSRPPIWSLLKTFILGVNANSLINLDL